MKRPQETAYPRNRTPIRWPQSNTRWCSSPTRLLWLALCAAACSTGSGFGADQISYPFPGVKLLKRTTTTPRTLFIALLEIKLRSPGIEFFSTPGNGDDVCDTHRRQTSTFLSEFGLDGAINANFFGLCGSEADLNHFAGSQGQIVSGGDGWGPVLTITQANEVRMARDFTLRPSDWYTAVSGLGNSYLLVTDGVNTGADALPEPWNLHPRTAVGVDQTGDTFYMVVVDGRQPGWSEGMTLPELADLMISFGAYQAINLDGGGSTTMVIRQDGVPVLVNSPSDGSERLVGNHLGFWVWPILGDLDQDGDVDEDDFGLFADCYTGPGENVAGGCEEADLDDDGDADLIDFATLQMNYTGSL